MVRGLDLFRQHFAADADRYVLIGGVAASVLMDEAGLEFRATKDLDIVLIVEVLDAGFGARLWEFIRAGVTRSARLATGHPGFTDSLSRPTRTTRPCLSCSRADRKGLNSPERRR